MSDEEAAAEIEHLRQLVKTLADADPRHDLYQQMYAENERLRAALKPFADVVDEEHQIFRGDPEAETVEIGNWAHLRYNDFVRARRALDGEKG